jgi:hypothetical protein
MHVPVHTHMHMHNNQGADKSRVYRLNGGLRARRAGITWAVSCRRSTGQANLCPVFVCNLRVSVTLHRSAAQVYVVQGTYLSCDSADHTLCYGIDL